MKALLTTITIAVLAMVLFGCNSSSGHKEKIYDIKGKVVSLDLDNKTVRLDHEDIPGFMKAMEMEFSVQASKILDGLKAGDQVKGRLKVNESDYVIMELQKR